MGNSDLSAKEEALKNQLFAGKFLNIYCIIFTVVAIALFLYGFSAGGIF